MKKISFALLLACTVGCSSSTSVPPTPQIANRGVVGTWKSTIPLFDTVSRDPRRLTDYISVRFDTATTGGYHAFIHYVDSASGRSSLVLDSLVQPTVVYQGVSEFFFLLLNPQPGWGCDMRFDWRMLQSHDSVYAFPFGIPEDTNDTLWFTRVKD